MKDSFSILKNPACPKNLSLNCPINTSSKFFRSKLPRKHFVLPNMNQKNHMKNKFDVNRFWDYCSSLPEEIKSDYPNPINIRIGRIQKKLLSNSPKKIYIENGGFLKNSRFRSNRFQTQTGLERISNYDSPEASKIREYYQNQKEPLKLKKRKQKFLNLERKIKSLHKMNYSQGIQTKAIEEGFIVARDLNLERRRELGLKRSKSVKNANSCHLTANSCIRNVLTEIDNSRQSASSNGVMKRDTHNYKDQNGDTCDLNIKDFHKIILSSGENKENNQSCVQEVLNNNDKKLDLKIKFTNSLFNNQLSDRTDFQSKNQLLSKRSMSQREKQLKMSKIYAKLASLNTTKKDITASDVESKCFESQKINCKEESILVSGTKNTVDSNQVALNQIKSAIRATHANQKFQKSDRSSKTNKNKQFDFRKILKLASFEYLIFQNRNQLKNKLSYQIIPNNNFQISDSKSTNSIKDFISNRCPKEKKDQESSYKTMANFHSPKTIVHSSSKMIRTQGQLKQLVSTPPTPHQTWLLAFRKKLHRIQNQIVETVFLLESSERPSIYVECIKIFTKNIQVGASEAKLMRSIVSSNNVTCTASSEALQPLRNKFIQSCLTKTSFRDVKDKVLLFDESRTTNKLNPGLTKYRNSDNRTSVQNNSKQSNFSFEVPVKSNLVCLSSAQRSGLFDISMIKKNQTSSPKTLLLVKEEISLIKIFCDTKSRKLIKECESRNESVFNNADLSCHNQDKQSNQKEVKVIPKKYKDCFSFGSNSKLTSIKKTQLNGRKNIFHKPLQKFFTSNQKKLKGKESGQYGNNQTEAGAPLIKLATEINKKCLVSSLLIGANKVRLFQRNIDVLKKVVNKNTPTSFSAIRRITLICRFLQVLEFSIKKKSFTILLKFSNQNNFNKNTDKQERITKKTSSKLSWDRKELKNNLLKNLFTKILRNTNSKMNNMKRRSLKLLRTTIRKSSIGNSFKLTDKCMGFQMGEQKKEFDDYFLNHMLHMGNSKVLLQPELAERVSVNSGTQPRNRDSRPVNDKSIFSKEDDLVLERRTTTRSRNPKDSDRQRQFPIPSYKIEKVTEIKSALFNKERQKIYQYKINDLQTLSRKRKAIQARTKMIEELMSDSRVKQDLLQNMLLAPAVLPKPTLSSNMQRRGIRFESESRVEVLPAKPYSAANLNIADSLGALSNQITFRDRMSNIKRRNKLSKQRLSQQKSRQVPVFRKNTDTVPSSTHSRFNPDIPLQHIPINPNQTKIQKDNKKVFDSGRKILIAKKLKNKRFRSVKSKLDLPRKASKLAQNNSDRGGVPEISVSDLMANKTAGNHRSKQTRDNSKQTKKSSKKRQAEPRKQKVFKTPLLKPKKRKPGKKSNGQTKSVKQKRSLASSQQSQLGCSNWKINEINSRLTHCSRELERNRVIHKHNLNKRPPPMVFSLEKSPLTPSNLKLYDEQIRQKKISRLNSAKSVLLSKEITNLTDSGTFKEKYLNSVCQLSSKFEKFKYKNLDRGNKKEIDKQNSNDRNNNLKFAHCIKPSVVQQKGSETCDLSIYPEILKYRKYLTEPGGDTEKQKRVQRRIFRSIKSLRSQTSEDWKHSSEPNKNPQNVQNTEKFKKNKNVTSNEKSNLTRQAILKPNRKLKRKTLDQENHKVSKDCEKFSFTSKEYSDQLTDLIGPTRKRKRKRRSGPILKHMSKIDKVRRQDRTDPSNQNNHLGLQLLTSQNQLKAETGSRTSTKQPLLNGPVINVYRRLKRDKSKAKVTDQQINVRVSESINSQAIRKQMLNSNLFRRQRSKQGSNQLSLPEQPSDV